MNSRIAVIAIGSNSIRLLAADANNNLTNSYRAKRESRLFLGMQSGLLCPAALQEAREAVKALQADALLQNATRIDLIATSAVRDADNSCLLKELLKTDTGLDLQILTGMEEASYSFLGAAAAGLSGVLDIGGGSTEMSIGEGRHLYAAVSAQAGASRLFREQPINSREDIEGALEKARIELEPSVLALETAPRPESWRITGGTGTTLAAVIQSLPVSANSEGVVVTRRHIKDCLFRIAALPSWERSMIIGLPKTRVDIFPTGLCLLLSAMELLHIHEITVTTRGNTDGWLLSIVNK